MKVKTYLVVEWVTNSIDHHVVATSQAKAKEIVSAGNCCHGQHDQEYANSKLARPVLIKEEEVLS